MSESVLRLSPEVVAQVRELRAAGVKVRDMARQFKVSADQIYLATKDMPTDRRTIKHRMSRLIRDRPEMTDEQIAEEIGHGCHPMDVADRRIEYARNQRCIRVDAGSLISDKVDTGARIPATWLRQHCSRGQRDLWQIQAIWTQRFTITDIRLSCELAGLKVHPTSKLVGIPPGRKAASEDRPSTRVIKVGCVSGRKGRMIR